MFPCPVGHVGVFTPTLPCPPYLQPQVNTTTKYQSITTFDWVLDSGVSHHANNDLVNLLLHYLYFGSDNVILGDGTCLSIQNFSTMQLSSSTHTLMLDNVLHVSAMYMNLILVSTLCASNVVIVLFFLSLFSGAGSSNGAIMVMGK